ncbi:MAG: hypothetical protein BZY88_04280 [SAR202 cluster bacterium Io17-Chloro-G9]|nr:MAG: hypothetical protein BZY88_04280 [SAR202 cluster bacterium Io17-Chloro-G9]
MPRYDYRCTGCGNEFELRQTFSEAGRGTCPLCSGAGQRVFHAVPVIYKGSGFYTTDYGRPKRPAENNSKESADSDKASTKATSSDSGEKASSDSGASSSGETKTEPAPKAASETSG